MAFKITLDNQTLDQPDVDALEFTIERGSISDDEYFEGLISTFELSDLTFYGSAFEYIKSEWTSNNACGEILVTITTDCCTDQVYYGLIELADVQINDCSAVCSIIDDGFGSRIKKNRDVSINLGGKVSRNGVAIGITPQVYEITNGQVKTGGTGTVVEDKDVYGYELDESLQHMLNYLTDGKITLTSTLLSSGTRYMLTTGHNLYYGTNSKSPTLSINCLLSALKKWLCANWSINGTDMRVEDVDYFYDAEPYRKIECPKNYVNTVCDNFMYSGVKVGDPDGFTAWGDGGVTVTIVDGEDTTYEQLDRASLPDGYLSSQNEANFTATGSCVLDNELDLTSDCIRHSSNLIQFMTFSDFGDDLSKVSNYFDDVFIVEITRPANVDELGTNTFVHYGSSNIDFSNTLLFNNPSLTNEAILARWNGYIPETLNTGLDCSAVSGGASTASATDIVSAAPVTADVDVSMSFDTDDNNFDTSTQLFTANYSGLYSITTEYCIQMSGGNPSLYEYTPKVKIHRTNGEAQTLTAPTHNMANDASCSCSNYTYTTVFLNEGDQVEPLVSFFDGGGGGNLYTITACVDSEMTVVVDCEDEFLSDTPRLSTCSTFESLESTCSINDLIDNSDKTIVLPRGGEFIKKVVINAKTGLTSWQGVSRF